MVNMAKRAGLPWDCILGAEIARAYKPAAETYLASCRALALAPAEVLMVAAHNPDLKAAKAAGLATAFVARPREHGPGQSTDLEPDPSAVDISAKNFNDLAAHLGA
jgi:2-haloacid dehalogenase